MCISDFLKPGKRDFAWEAGYNTAIHSFPAMFSNIKVNKNPESSQLLSFEKLLTLNSSTLQNEWS